MSCVRATSGGGSIGFVNDVRRLNVAITRAKLALWILGSRATLQVRGGLPRLACWWCCHARGCRRMLQALGAGSAPAAGVLDSLGSLQMGMKTRCMRLGPMYNAGAIGDGHVPAGVAPLQACQAAGQGDRAAANMRLLQSTAVRRQAPMPQQQLARHSESRCLMHVGFSVVRMWMRPLVTAQAVQLKVADATSLLCHGVPRGWESSRPCPCCAGQSCLEGTAGRCRCKRPRHG